MDQVFTLLGTYQKRGYYFISYKEWIVVVEETKDTYISEPILLPSEEMFDYNLSKYGGMEFTVIQIINKFNFEFNLDTLECSYTTTPFRIGKIVRTKFEKRIEDTKPMWGITFFKSFEPAYYDNLDLLDNYTGKMKAWHRNGKLWYECNYVNGTRHGTFREYYKSGELAEVVNYELGNLKGSIMTYDKAGNIMKS